MIPLPVISRELLAAARHPFTYWLRVLGVGALLAVCILVDLMQPNDATLGIKLFSALHGTLLCAIWVLVPLLTADTISRERREGTLPLLFLTPLKPIDIVLAKSAAQGLRALTLWLAALPTLAIPLIAGGVSWAEAVFSVLLNFSSICLVTAGGLLASARCKSWSRALALSGCVAFALLFAFTIILGLLVTPLVSAAFPGAWPGSAAPHPFALGLILMLDWDAAWQEILSSSTAGYWPLLQLLLMLSAFSFGFFIICLRLTARTVGRVWLEEPPSTRVVRLQKEFCTPVIFPGWFRRWMRWELEHNPIGWLERRTWTSRLVTWSWLAVVISFYSSFIGNMALYSHRFVELQLFLGSLLIGSLAISAAGSFRRERETGVLELLLVAPLREWQIIGGRMRGVWSQFLPALTLLLGAWLYCASFLEDAEATRFVFFFVSTFLTLPVIGLYYSLSLPTFISAFVRTLVAGLLLPLVLVRLGDLAYLFLWVFGKADMWFGYRARPLPIPPEIAQLGLGFFFAWRLHANLKGRDFVSTGKAS